MLAASGRHALAAGRRVAVLHHYYSRFLDRDHDTRVTVRQARLVSFLEKSRQAGHYSPGMKQRTTIRREGDTWMFSVPQRSDRLHRPGRYRLVLMFSVLALLGLTLLYVIPGPFRAAGEPIDWQTLLIGLLASAAVLALAFGGRVVSARLVPPSYEVYVDLAARTVTAIDSRKQQPIWQQPFNPEYLYLGETEIPTRISSHRSPALIYGEERPEVVNYELPHPRHVVLATAPGPTLADVRRRMLLGMK